MSARTVYTASGNPLTVVGSHIRDGIEILTATDEHGTTANIAAHVVTNAPTRTPQSRSDFFASLRADIETVTR